MEVKIEKQVEDQEKGNGEGMLKVSPFGIVFILFNKIISNMLIKS